MVEGRLQTREWEGKDGQRRNVVEVVAERVQFLGRPKAGSPAATGPAEAEGGFEESPGQGDDVPF
jgi:single-strand DNA-binding protein